MTRTRQLVARALIGAAVGFFAGMLVHQWFAGLSVASARIAFPEPRALMAFPKPNASDLPSVDYYLWRSPVDWVQTTLRSTPAIDALCQILQKQGENGNPQAIRAAVMLLEEDRLKIVPSEQRHLTVEVKAEEPDVAVALCQGLLQYLEENSVTVMERQIAEAEERIPTPKGSAWAQFVRGEAELLEQARAESSKSLGLDASPRVRQPGATATPTAGNSEANDARALQTITRTSYLENIRNLRQAQQMKLYARLQAGSLTPTFVVVDPPAVIPQRFQGIGWGILGMSAGALLAALGSTGSRARKRSV